MEDDNAGAQQTPRLDRALDNRTQISIEQRLQSLPVDGTVRIVQWQGPTRPYYSVHGEGTVNLFSSLYSHHNMERALIGKTLSFPSVSFSDATFPSIVEDLLIRQGKRLEVWMNTAAKGLKIQWECTKQGSPGHLNDFEQYIVSGGLHDSPVVMATVLAREAGHTVFGCAYCNTTLRTIGVAQFADGDQFLNFESFVVQVGAKECVVVSDPKSRPKAEDGTAAAVVTVPTSESLLVSDILHRASVVRTEVPRSHYSTKTLPDDLNNCLLSPPTELHSDPQYSLAMQAVSCLLKFLSLTDDETNRQQYNITVEDLKRFMRLDTAAVNALHVLPGPEMAGAVASASLFGLLNRCRTGMGVRALRRWITQPLLDVKHIERRQNLVEIFVNDVLFCTSLRDDVLKHLPDLDIILKKIQRRHAKLSDTIVINRMLEHVPLLLAALEQYDGPHAALLGETWVEPLREVAQYFSTLQHLIDCTLDTTGDEVLINPNFDDSLEDLHRQRTEVDYEVNKLFKKFRSAVEVKEKDIKMERTPNGLVFRMSRAKGVDLSDQITKLGYDILNTTKSGTTFTSDALKGLNSDYSDIMKQYTHRQAQLERRFLETVATYIPVLEQVKEHLSMIDVILSFAIVSLEAPAEYVRPVVHDRKSRILRVEAARHPMLEVSTGSPVIPNDIDMGETDPGGNGATLLLLTGPNMGGKSTYLRTTALVQLMAQLGMWVPAKKAEVSVRDAILCRVGATDHQIRGVSTFMAEMLETTSILGNATEQSLIIIDELGRGTSTNDGFGLAWAIAESIATEIGAFCLFATHFHELTHLSEHVNTVKNLHVTAETSHEGITMLYNVLQGHCAKSFGIQVAELAQFPESVVEAARRKANDLEQFDTTVVEGEPPSKVPRGEDDTDVHNQLKAFAAIPDLSSGEWLPLVKNMLLTSTQDE